MLGLENVTMPPIEWFVLLGLALLIAMILEVIRKRFGIAKALALLVVMAVVGYLFYLASIPISRSARYLFELEPTTTVQR